MVRTAEGASKESELSTISISPVDSGGEYYDWTCPAWLSELTLSKVIKPVTYSAHCDFSFEVDIASSFI